MEELLIPWKPKRYILDPETGELKAVYPGEEGYDTAPYGDIVFVPKDWNFKIEDSK